MITFSADCRIYISIDAIDFRCGLNKLVPLAQSVFAQDPRQRAIFVFRNRRRTDIKMLFFDRNGFFMGHKRLSRGKLEWWPRTKDECFGLNSEQLFRLLLGVDPRGSFHPSWARQDESLREDFGDQRCARAQGSPYAQSAQI
jgi:transposase